MAAGSVLMLLLSPGLAAPLACDQDQPPARCQQGAGAEGALARSAAAPATTPGALALMGVGLLVLGIGLRRSVQRRSGPQGR